MASASTEFAGGSSDFTSNVASKLKSAGVDTEVMANAAREQASELQRMVVDEMVRRPFHALGLAALVGFWYGLRLR